MIKIKNLFELSVYRLTEEKYYKNRNKHVEEINSKQPIPINIDYLHKEYGGDWKYNEIVGFLKFYQYGSNQIRCEYWETDAKLKVKTRKKQFIKISDSYCERKFSKDSSNDDLVGIIKECLDHCKSRLDKKKRYIDTEIFNNLVENISWTNVLL